MLYRLLIIIIIFQIVLLLFLPVLNFLIRNLVQKRKSRLLILTLCYLLCNIVLVLSMARVGGFSFHSATFLMIVLFYAECTILFSLIVYIVCRKVFRQCKDKSQTIVRLSFIPMFLLWFVWGAWAACTPRIVHFTTTINKSLSQPIKIALIADLHLGNLVGNRMLNKLDKILQQQNPDMVLLAGDIFDDLPVQYQQKNMGEIMKNIAKQRPVYATLGNHDNYRMVQNEIEAEMKDAGVIVLRDQSVLFDNKVWITGRRDRQEKNRLSADKLISDEIKNSQLPSIIIDHQPIDAMDNANANFDIQVSGHTHRGQTFPGTWLIYLFHDYVYGNYQVGNMQLFITCGYGLWGIPLRVGSRSEIMMIEVHGINR